MKARYDVDRARLDVDRGDTVARIENDKAKLALSDSQQRLRELEEKIKSDRTSAEADVAAKSRKREKALFDLQRAERGLVGAIPAMATRDTDADDSGVPQHLEVLRDGPERDGGNGSRDIPGERLLVPDPAQDLLSPRLGEYRQDVPARLHPSRLDRCMLTI